MRFRQRETIVSDFDASATVGATIQCPINSAYPVERLELIIPVTVGGTGTNTVVGDGLLGVAQQITLDVQDGNQGNRPVFSGQGAAFIIEDALRSGREYPANTTSRAAPATNGTYNVIVPLVAALPNVADPAKWNTLLPFHLYGDDPVLRVTLATRAQITSNASATITYGTPRVRVVQREVNIDGFSYFRFDAVEQQITHGAAGIVETKLPEFGVYTSILSRGFVSGDPAVILASAGEALLIRVADNILRYREDDQIEITRQRCNGFTGFTGAYLLDFLSGPEADGFSLNSCIDANLQSARVKLRQNINAACVQRLLTRRLLGDVSAWVAR
jgi:hypothetical protein